MNDLLKAAETDYYSRDQKVNALQAKVNVVLRKLDRRRPTETQQNQMDAWGSELDVERSFRQRALVRFYRLQGVYPNGQPVNENAERKAQS